MGLSKEAKNKYITDHPNSKYAKAAKQNRQIKKQFDKHPAGSLHTTMGVPKGTKLPIAKLRKMANSDHKLAGRARMALSLQGYKLKPITKTRKRRTKVL